MAGDHRWRAEPAQRLLATVCLSLVAIYLCVWLIYTLDLPNELAFGMVPLGLVGLNACRRRLAADTRDPLVRSLLVGQAAVLVWNLAWLAVVLSYSGQALLPFRTPPLLRSPTSC
jgi:hypothetical protein